MITTRVSNVEAYRQWKHWRPLFDGDEEPSLDDLVRRITTDEPSEQMKAGTAFHAALETAAYGEHDMLSANGYTFHLPDAEIALPKVRELRASKAYGDLTVSGKVDGLNSGLVVDHKTTSRIDVERYLEGYQYRFYLDIFGADVFQWNVWEIREAEPRVYTVAAPQILRAYRYPEIEEDCRRLAAEYHEFAVQHLKGHEPCLA